MRKAYVFLIMLSTVILIVLALPVSGQSSNDALALDVLARLNAWRIDEGLAPLKPNDTLAAMALHQAQYLASLPELPDDFHLDAQGLYPRERALLAPYNWPHYELPGQIDVGENAAVGTVTYALQFWHDSDIHRQTALNPAYREVGVAAVPYKKTTIFIVEFGGRPNVLPALVDPTDGHTLYLTNEQFQYARFFDSIQTVKKIQLFDRDGRPLYPEPIDWTNKLAAPSDAGGAVYILSMDGTHEVLSAVDLSRDRVILPGSLPAATAVPVVQAATATSQPVQPTPTVQAATQVAPTTAPTATMAPVTATPARVEGAPPQDLLILYNKDTLDVINVSGAAADWRSLELVGSGTTFPFTQWTKVVDLPLDALPARHCLQIRSQLVSGDVVKPEGCTWVRSLVTINPQRVFWAQGPFDVVRNGTTLVTCQPQAAACTVQLNAR